MRKDSKRSKLIKDMKEEYKAKTALLKRIEDYPRVQVQVALRTEHGYGGEMLYDNALDKLSLDIEKTALEIATKFEVINPIFKFQTYKEWKAIMITQAERDLAEYKENFKTLTEQTAKAKKSVADQKVRCIDRNNQILEQFSKWEVDMEEKNGI